MQLILKEKLWAYIVENCPDIMIRLQDRYSVTEFLSEKVESVMPIVAGLLLGGQPEYIILEVCMAELTRDMRPSKYHYIRNILDDEFIAEYLRWQDTGLLTYEIINLIEACEPVFESLGFTEENEQDPMLRNAVIGSIQLYLEGK